MNCPNCNAELADQAVACPSCRRYLAPWGYVPVATVKPSAPSPILRVLLIIAGGVVAVCGAIGIYGWYEWQLNAKTAEAKNALGGMAMDIVTSFEGESEDGTRRLCPSAKQPVPADRMAVSGKTYRSTPAEWAADGPNVGFGCLKFEMGTPQRYQYDYRATADTVVVQAHGDLDGDGKFSTYEMRASVVDGRVRIDPSITELDPKE